MAVILSNLNSSAGLKKLDQYLLTRSYISGNQASKDDLTVYAALNSLPSAEYVNASRWFLHIDALLRLSGVTSHGCGVNVEGFAPVKKASVPVYVDSDEEINVFDDKYEEMAPYMRCKAQANRCEL